MKDTVLRQILRHKNQIAHEMGTYKAFTSPVWRTIQMTGIAEMPVFFFLTSTVFQIPFRRIVKKQEE